MNRSQKMSLSIVGLILVGVAVVTVLLTGESRPTSDDGVLAVKTGTKTLTAVSAVATIDPTHEAKRVAKVSPTSAGQIATKAGVGTKPQNKSEPVKDPANAHTDTGTTAAKSTPSDKTHGEDELPDSGPSPLGQALQQALFSAVFPCMEAKTKRGESFDGVLAMDVRTKRDKEKGKGLLSELEKVDGPDLSEADYECIHDHLSGFDVPWKDEYADELPEDAWKNTKVELAMKLKGKKVEDDGD